MRMFAALLAATLSSGALFAADPAFESAEAKLDRIDMHNFRPGETIVFTPQEINAWARVRVPEAVPEGIRNPRVELGTDTANGYALVDFLKMRHAKGKSTNFLIAKMIEGERPLKISVRLVSAGGRCTVYLTRVELSGVVAEGQMLDFLVRSFFMPLFPDAHVNEPFELSDDIDRIAIRPDGIRVTMK